MKALLITPYYNCVTEYILLYYKEKIDALVFIEVDTITVSKMVEKYHLTNILCFSYEEYMLRNDIHIIDTDLKELNIPFDYCHQLQNKNMLYFSTNYNHLYKKNYSLLFLKKKIKDYHLINLTYRKFKNTIRFYDQEHTYYVYKNKNIFMIQNIYSKQYCYYLSWCAYFFDKKIIYTNHTVLLNIVLILLTDQIHIIIKQYVERILS